MGQRGYSGDRLRDLASNLQAEEAGSIIDHGDYCEMGPPIEMTLEWNSDTNTTEYKYNVSPPNIIEIQ